MTFNADAGLNTREVCWLVEAGLATNHDSSRNKSHNGANVRRHKPRRSKGGASNKISLLRTQSNACAMLERARRAITWLRLQLVEVAGCGYRVVKPAMPGT